MKQQSRLRRREAEEHLGWQCVRADSTGARDEWWPCCFSKPAKEVIDGAKYGLLRAALQKAGADEIPRDRLFPEVLVRRRK